MEKIIKTEAGRAHIYHMFGTAGSHAVDLYLKGKRKPYASKHFAYASDAEEFANTLKPESKPFSSFEVKTNNQARFLFFGHELTAKERAEFADYTEAELDNIRFFRYKGQVYQPKEFQHIIQRGCTKLNISDVFSMSAEMDKWDEVYSIDNWSGIIIRWCIRNHCESVIVGSYTC
jgi:hypothetical protein